MKLLFFITIGTLFNEGVDSKCDTLLMCPTFCMKVQKGCYVCDCGTFSNYLRQASNKMAEKSNTQQQQTGTRLSSYTSGYGSTGNENEMLKSNDQRLKDYTNMMELGLQFMNIQSRPLDRQNVESANPGFINYGHNFQNMPGMNCKPVDIRCPSSCWSTNVFTGCVHCACDDRFLDSQNIKSTPSSRTTQTTSPKNFQNPNIKNLSGTFGSTTVSSLEQTPLSASQGNLVNEHVSITKPYYLPNILPIKVPTKPPIQQIHEKGKNVTTEPFTKVKSEDNTTRHSGDILPTHPSQKVNESVVPTLSTLNTKLNLFETRISFNKNEPNKPDKGIYSNKLYPTPALIPEADQSSARKSNSEFYPKHGTVKVGNNVGTNQQLESNSEESTNISNVIDPFDPLRDNSAYLTMDNEQKIKQSDASSISNPSQKPLIVVKMNHVYQTTAIQEEQILINQQLPYIGHGDYYIDNTSSQDMDNYVGFYGHSKTG